MDGSEKRSAAWRAAFSPVAPEARPPFGMGHHGGPPLGGRGTLILWQKAQAAAWKSAPIEVVRRRVKAAAEAGLTYHEYTLEILERGIWLDPKKDAARIRAIKACRQVD